jgi:hypothetical protein
VIRWQRKGKSRHPARTWLIRSGIIIIAVSGTYLLCGIAGLVPLETEVIAWNNLRLVAGASILGCLIAAVGYGNE